MVVAINGIMRCHLVVGFSSSLLFLVSCNDSSKNVKAEIDETKKEILENSKQIDHSEAERLLKKLKEHDNSHKYDEKDSLADEEKN